jgi:hypothetical protein
MNALRRAAIALMLLSPTFALQAGVLAQRSNEPQGIERPEPAPDNAASPVEEPDRPEFHRRASPVFRLGGDYKLGPADEARAVVIVSGQAQIDGHVYEDLVVLFGETSIADTATIDGNVVVIGGSVSVATGAKVRRGFTAVGSNVSEGPGFTPGDEHVVIDPRAIGIDSAALGA